jgi:hypothetical protein
MKTEQKEAEGEGKMQKEERRMKKSEGKGQRTTVPHTSEGAQNMLRAAVREAGRP